MNSVGEALDRKLGEFHRRQYLAAVEKRLQEEFDFEYAPGRQAAEPFREAQSASVEERRPLADLTLVCDETLFMTVGGAFVTALLGERVLFTVSDAPEIALLVDTSRALEAVVALNPLSGPGFHLIHPHGRRLIVVDGYVERQVEQLNLSYFDLEEKELGLPIG